MNAYEVTRLDTPGTVWVAFPDGVPRLIRNRRQRSAPRRLQGPSVWDRLARDRRSWWGWHSGGRRKGDQ